MLVEAPCPCSVAAAAVPSSAALYAQRGSDAAGTTTLTRWLPSSLCQGCVRTRNILVPTNPCDCLSVVWDPSGTVQGDNINAIVKASGNTVQGFWGGLFAKILNGQDLDNIIMKPGASRDASVAPAVPCACPAVPWPARVVVDM